MTDSRVPLRVADGKTLAQRLTPGWRAARRVVQLACLALFFYLFRATEYTDSDTLSKPVNLFFRIDPLVGASAMIAERVIISAFWPAVILLVATIVFGRFFCGWICPLGTLLDYVHRIVSPITNRLEPKMQWLLTRIRPLRYMLLVMVLVGAFVSFPLVGFLDPYALLTRGLTFSIDPAMSRAMEQTTHAPAFLMPVVKFIKNHLIAYQSVVFSMAGLSLALLLVIAGLELIGRRFWCRYVCPLGAALGPFAHWSLARRIPFKACPKCAAGDDCASTCRMAAFNKDKKFITESCTLCMDCVADCPSNLARIKVSAMPKAPVVPLELSRRGFVTSLAVGVALPISARAASLSAKRDEPKLLRPPGGRNEEKFLDLCIRCGECMKVCSTNALQPAGFASGIDSVFSPAFNMRQGYCEYNCNLCGQVCPTGAIPNLSLEIKQKTVIGKAFFDTKRCLPWAKNEECICCEEHCPLPEKAIQFRDVEVVGENGEKTTVQRPFVDHRKCIGCGICENKCPLDGEAAIHVRVIVQRKKTATTQSAGTRPKPE